MSGFDLSEPPFGHSHKQDLCMTMPDSIICNDCLGAYDMLEVSEFQHVQINRSELFAEDRNHINGVGRVWTVMPVRRRRRSADKPLRHSR